MCHFLVGHVSPADSPVSPPGLLGSVVIVSLPGEQQVGAADFGHVTDGEGDSGSA